MADKSKTLSIVFEEAPDRQFFPVGGAWGGPSPDGSTIYAHVYYEYSTLPAMSDHEIDAAGSVDLSKGNQIRRADVTRYVQATLVFSPESAVSMGNWLIKNAQTAIERRGKKKS